MLVLDVPDLKVSDSFNQWNVERVFFFPLFHTKNISLLSLLFLCSVGLLKNSYNWSFQLKMFLRSLKIFLLKTKKNCYLSNVLRLSFLVKNNDHGYE